jgi:diguanylate cyclase (GGDEF)-like protein
MYTQFFDLLRTNFAAILTAAGERLSHDRIGTFIDTLDSLQAYLRTGDEQIAASWASQRCMPVGYTMASSESTDALDELDILAEIVTSLLTTHVSHADDVAVMLGILWNGINHLRRTCYTASLSLFRQSASQLTQQIEQYGHTEQTLRDQIFDLQILYDLTRRIGYTLNYSDLMRLIHDNLHRAMPFDVAVGLVITDDMRLDWICQTSRPLTAGLQAEIVAHIRRVLEQFSMPENAADPSTQNWQTRTHKPDAPPLTALQSVFLVPFLTGNSSQITGLLMVGAEQPDAFSEEQVRLLYTVANQAMLSIQQLRALLDSEHRGMENLMRNVPIGIIVLDANYRITLKNPAASTFLAMLLVDKLDQPMTHIGSIPVEVLVSEGRSWELTTSGPQSCILHVTGSHIADVARNTEGWVLVIDDVTERKEAEERIRYMALYDALTDLPNRVLFRDRLRQAIARAQRSGTLVAVMFLDLDRFKAINDTLGHAIGDQLLQVVAQRLRHCVRASDTVARLGGDEFTIILTGLTKTQDAAQVAQKILEALSEPIYLDGRELYTSTSIGITLYPSDASDVDNLIKYADVAMYRAKHQGRNSYTFYTSDMHVQAMEWLTLERDMRISIDRNDFFLHYQPQYNLKTGAIVGVEVLVRWQHPDLGLLSPTRFIPIAEETGLIIPLGFWILRTACLQNRSWQMAGLPPLHIAVNLSARQLAWNDLVGEIAQILHDTEMAPEYLVLELTESTIMHDTETMVARLRSLKALGLRLAIDDFGTGYSSLSHLKRLPIDTLKIDRSFVHDIPNDRDDAAIATTIIAMTQALNLKVIAEGVESESQELFLRQQGCHEIQGYLYSQPISAADMTLLLQQKAMLIRRQHQG